MNHHAATNWFAGVIAAATVALAVFSCQPAHAFEPEKRTTCEQDMVFTAMFAHPKVSPQELDAYISMVQPGDKDAAVWDAIADAIAMYQMHLGRPMTDGEIDLLVKQVEGQCYQVKGV